jgi:hypothetical protein
MRSFVVAVWQQRRQRQRELRSVDAETAELAVFQVAAEKPEEDRNGVYEAWPEGDPGQNLRLTLGDRRAQLSLRA